LGGKMGREMTLRRALRDVERRHELIRIDCRPALGLLTVNAVVAADYALISTEAQYFSLRGVEQALEIIELAKENLHPDLEWLGVVLNIADLRTIHSREALTQLRERFADRVFDSVIRQSIRYAESAERGISILDYRPELGDNYLAHAAVRRDLAEVLDQRPGLLPVAPEQDRRPRARDRSADGAQLPGPAQQLHRPRVQALAAGLVEAVVEAAGHQVEIAARQPEHQ